MSGCEKCLQRLHYIRYLESKIRVLQYKLKLESMISDESDTSEDSSSDTNRDTLEQKGDTDLGHVGDTVPNSSSRRVIEIPRSTWEDARKTEACNARKQVKRKRH